MRHVLGRHLPSIGYLVNRLYESPAAKQTDLYAEVFKSNLCKLVLNDMNVNIHLLLQLHHYFNPVHYSHQNSLSVECLKYHSLRSVFHLSERGPWTDPLAKKVP